VILYIRYGNCIAFDRSLLPAPNNLKTVSCGLFTKSTVAFLSSIVPSSRFQVTELTCRCRKFINSLVDSSSANWLGSISRRSSIRNPQGIVPRDCMWVNVKGKVFLRFQNNICPASGQTRLELQSNTGKARGDLLIVLSFMPLLLIVIFGTFGLLHS
jgi:hypothetical protein